MGTRIFDEHETTLTAESQDRDHNNLERNRTMKDSKSVTKDPICGMTVDEATALHAEREGKTFYFCSDHCRQKFLSTPAGAKPADKSGGCCK
jgi:YHS domain-containing protein